jgi:uncharacterized protein YggL (DUF469 family)
MMDEEYKAAKVIHDAVSKLTVEEFQTLCHWIITSFQQRQMAMIMLANMTQCLQENGLDMAENKGTKH